MSEGFVSHGFHGRRRRRERDGRLPPSQYLVDGFPVLSAGPTPHTPLEPKMASQDHVSYGVKQDRRGDYHSY